MQTLDVISVNIWQILISLCNLLIMFLILKKLLFGPVQNILAQRQEQVNKIYDDAKNDREAAGEMKKQYEEHLSGARAEADSIVKSATANAQKRADSIVAEASQEAVRTRQRAAEDIERDRRQMLSEVRGEISELAVGIASKVVEKEIDQKAYDSFVDDFIRNVGDEQ